MIAACSRSSPLPVLAETVTIDTPLICGNNFSRRSPRNLSFSCFSSSTSHLFTAITTARPSRSARSAMRKSCASNGMAASSKTTTTSANLTARRPSATESFSSFSCTRARLRIPAVSKIRIGTPSHVTGREIASRVIPASGPVSNRSSPKIWLMRVDLPALGRPITAICKGRSSVNSRSPPSSVSSSSSSISVSGL